ncbi:MAG TPA: FtsX-like permease family protein [Gaiellaceae bacterium]|nr:FtsX-like permease family protein [Gaiellaceae bacterium]
MRQSVSLLLARRSVRRRPLRAMLTAAGVILGVAMIVAVLSLSATLFGGFRGLFDTVYGKTDLIVTRDSGTGIPAPFSETVLAKVRAVPGVDADGTTGEATGVAQVVGANGRTTGAARNLVYVGGFERGKVAAVAEFVRVAGRDPLRAGEIAVQQQLAAGHGLRVGDRIRLAVPSGIRTYRISGIFRFARAVGGGGATFAAVTLHEAQRVFGLSGRLTQINVRVRDRARVLAVQKALRAALGPDLSVRTRSESINDLAAQLAGLRTFLLFFAGVALFVGAYLIFNGFNVSVLQRTREIGMLRTLGVTKPGVARQVLAEATTMGVAGSLLGLAAGVGLAWGLVKLTARLFVGIPSGSLVVPASALVWGTLAGTLVTAGGALWPAVRAGRTSPLAAMLQRAERIGRIPWRSAALGLLLVAASVPGVWLLTERSSGGTAYGVAGVGGIFLGVTLASPLVARPLVQLLARPLRLLGRVQAQIASTNAARSPSRTGQTASAVMVGLSLVVVFGAFSASAISAVNEAVDRQVRSDFVVGPKNLFNFQGFAPSLERRIAALPAARAASGIVAGFVRVNDVGTAVLGYDPATIGELSGDELVGGGTPPWGALAGRAALVTEGWARPHHVRVGEALRIRTPSGEDVVRVAGVIRSLDQHVIVSRARAAADVGATQVFYVYVKADDSPEARAALRRQLERVVADYPTATVLSNEELKNQIAARFDQIFALIYALLGAAVLAGAFGIANTMAMSVIERTREIGLIRAVGGTRGQVRAMIRRESVLVTLVGVALGLAVGLVLAFAFIRASASRFPGLGFVVPWTVIAVVVAGSVAVALLAAFMPARRAARLNVIEAVGYE